jgi:hypothetical protein
LKHKRIFAIFFLLPFAVCLFADGVAVPDIETRIRNSGNTVPDSALPAVTSPASVPVPQPGESVPSAPVPPALVPPAAAPEAIVPPDDSVTPPAPSPSPITGSINLKAGSPDSLFADVNLAKASGALPGFAVKFGYDAADGYGSWSAGNGFFDRTTIINARVFDDRAKSGWFTDIGLTERSDGFQGKNIWYYGLSGKNVSLKGGITGVPLMTEGISFSASGDGSLFSFYEDSPRPATASELISDYRGYNLSPRISFDYVKGGFAASLSGRYAYETAVDNGEFHDANGTLSLRYGRGGFDFAASASIAGDSNDGILDPFSLSFAWNSPDFVLRHLTLSGGLSKTLYSSRLLAAQEPFVALSGLSVNAADWTASGSFSLSPLDRFSIDAGAEYRKTAFHRGILVLTDTIDATSRIPFIRTDRNSLVTKASVTGTGDWISATAGYSGEWMDRLYRRSLHQANAGVTVFTPGAERTWEAGIKTAFDLDFADIPILSASGSFRPVHNFAISLSVDDSLPLALGKTRTRNGLYAERSGSCTLSALINF